MNKHLLLLSLIALLLGGCEKCTSDASPYEAYLFAYFTGNSGDEEAVRYAVSDNGYHYRTLNNNLPVIFSQAISKTGGVRDPHLLRSEDGKLFYMVLTDMVSARGWSSNRGIVLLSSPDLVNWSSKAIDFQERFQGQDSLLRVWAPQTIYDKEAGRYMIYFSLKYGDQPDKIHYVYANDDFTDILGEPQPLFNPRNGRSCIDGDVVYKDGLYHLFYKTEDDGNGIRKATAPSLTSGQWEQWDDYKQCTTRPVEGMCVFQLIDQPTYILMYDVYMDGKYQFCESSDLSNFRVVDSQVTMDFHPRHGTVIPITKAEKEQLITTFGFKTAHQE